MQKRPTNLLQFFWGWILTLFKYITPIATFCLAIITIPEVEEFFSSTPWVFKHKGDLIWIIILINFICAIFNIFYERSIVYLKKENDKLSDRLTVIATNTENLFNGYLYTLYTKRLKGEASDRITIYIHNANHQQFIPCGRYSLNNEFQKKGRPAYPEREGIIAKVWQSHWYYKNYLTEKEAKEDSRKTYHMSRDTYRGLKMKSLCFAGLVIRHENTPYGLIMFESERSDRFSENEIKTLLEDQTIYLADLVSKLKDYIPEPPDTRSEEF